MAAETLSTLLVPNQSCALAGNFARVIWNPKSRVVHLEVTDVPCRRSDPEVFARAFHDLATILLGSLDPRSTVLVVSLKFGLDGVYRRLGLIRTTIRMIDLDHVRRMRIALAGSAIVAQSKLSRFIARLFIAHIQPTLPCGVFRDASKLQLWISAIFAKDDTRVQELLASTVESEVGDGEDGVDSGSDNEPSEDESDSVPDGCRLR